LLAEDDGVKLELLNEPRNGVQRGFIVPMHDKDLITENGRG
jgi:hypothetical protein